MNYQRKRKVIIKCADGTQKVLYEPYNVTPPTTSSQLHPATSAVPESIHSTFTLPAQHQQIIRSSRGQSSKHTLKNHHYSAPYPYPSAAPLTEHPMPTPQPHPSPHPYSRPHRAPKDRESAYGNNHITVSKPSQELKAIDSTGMIDVLMENGQDIPWGFVVDYCRPFDHWRVQSINDNPNCQAKTKDIQIGWYICKYNGKLITLGNFRSIFADLVAGKACVITFDIRDALNHVDGKLPWIAWKCEKCTYVNSISDAKCKICLKGDCSDEATEFLLEKSWSCPCCTFINFSDEPICTMCNEGKQFPTQLKSTPADIEVNQPSIKPTLSPPPESPKRTATKKLSITTKLTMDLIEPTRIYFITASAAELKAEWGQVFISPLCDAEKEAYLGQRVKCMSVNAESKTAKVRFDPSKKPFLIPVGALYKSFKTEVETDSIRSSESESTELFLIDEDYAKEVLFSDDSILDMGDDYDYGNYVADIDLSSDSDDDIFDDKKLLQNKNK